jgi:hypothetical protein
MEVGYIRMSQIDPMEVGYIRPNLAPNSDISNGGRIYLT